MYNIYKVMSSKLISSLCTLLKKYFGCAAAYRMLKYDLTLSTFATFLLISLFFTVESFRQAMWWAEICNLTIIFIMWSYYFTVSSSGFRDLKLYIIFEKPHRFMLLTPPWSSTRVCTRVKLLHVCVRVEVFLLETPPLCWHAVNV